MPFSQVTWLATASVWAFNLLECEDWDMVVWVVFVRLRILFRTVFYCVEMFFVLLTNERSLPCGSASLNLLRLVFLVW